MNQTIHTQSFNLATYIKGDTQSDKFALILPGLLDTKDYLHMTSHVDFLATKGYLALSFDPAGTWESDGGLDMYTITNYFTAINELIEYFGNKPTFVMGHSLGGEMAMLSAINNPSVVAFAAIMAPPSFVRVNNYEERVVQWKADGFKPSYRDMPNDFDTKKQFDLPYAFSEDAQQYNVLSDLPFLSIPKLFIAGDQDVSVQPEVVQQTYDVSVQPKFIHILKSDHNYRLHPKLIDEVNNLVNEFLGSL